MNSRISASLLLIGALVIASIGATPVHAQPLKIGLPERSVDSCLSGTQVVPSDMESGDSVCLGAKFWDLDGHLLFHIDSVEHTLTKVDWSAYMPIERMKADTIAKEIETALGPCERARNHDWVYWIWDNDEIHYSLGYSTGTLRLLEFQDEGGLNACMLH